MTATLPETNYGARNKTEFLEIDVTIIYPSADNPRRKFDEASLQNLTDSIRLMGVLEPIVVREISTGYAIIAGERRWRAARLAGHTHIPSVLRDCTELDALLMTFVENKEREDLDPISEARAYQTMMHKYGMKQELIADRARCSQETISHAVRLLSLPEDVQTLIADGPLTASHGKALCALSDYPEQARHWGRVAAEESWPTRKLQEQIASFLTSQREKEQPRLPETEGPTQGAEALQGFMTETGDVCFADVSSESSETETTAQASDDPSDEDSDESNDTPAGFDPQAEQTAQAALQRPDTSNLLRPMTPDNQSAGPHTNATVVTSPTATTPTGATAASTPALAQSTTPATPPSAMISVFIPNALDDWLWELGINITQALELLKRIQTCAEASDTTLQEFVTRIESETFNS